MKRLVFSVFTLIVLFGLSGCSSSPKDTLKSSIDEYTKCAIDSDFKCVSKFIDPNTLSTMGGIDGFEKMMKPTAGMISDIKIKNIGEIQKKDDVLSSSITYSQTIKMDGKEMKMDTTLNAISNDNGSTWYFAAEQ